MKLGVFGGTFDPFTSAHREIVDKALELVDRVLIVPTTISYYRDGKSPLFSFKQRCDIIREVINKYWCNSKVKISFLEKDKDSFWRTADTIRSLKKSTNDELYFILGSDSFDCLDSWGESDYLKENLKFIVVEGRNGVKTTNTFPHETIFIERNEISASLLREVLINEMKQKYIKLFI